MKTKSADKLKLRGSVWRPERQLLSTWIINMKCVVCVWDLSDHWTHHWAHNHRAEPATVFFPEALVFLINGLVWHLLLESGAFLFFLTVTVSDKLYHKLSGVQFTWITGDQWGHPIRSTNNGGVICKFNHRVWRVNRGAVVHKQCEVHWTQHTALWDTSTDGEGGGDVLTHSNLLWLACKEVYDPWAQRGAKAQSVQFCDQLVGMTVLNTELNSTNNILT